MERPHGTNHDANHIVRAGPTETRYHERAIRISVTYIQPELMCGVER